MKCLDSMYSSSFILPPFHNRHPPSTSSTPSQTFAGPLLNQCHFFFPYSPYPHIIYVPFLQDMVIPTVKLPPPALESSWSKILLVF